MQLILFEHDVTGKILVRKKKTIPLHQVKEVSFDQIEIITRKYKKRININQIKNLSNPIKNKINSDLKKVKSKIKNFSNFDFSYSLGSFFSRVWRDTVEAGAK